MPLDEISATQQPADAGNNPWPEIDRRLIDVGRRTPVPFPLEVLPDRWRAWVEATARSIPADYVAQGLLGAVAAQCGGGIVACPTTQWGEPLVLWQALVGAPSSGKSPAMAATRWLLELIERAAEDARREKEDEGGGGGGDGDGDGDGDGERTEPAKPPAVEIRNSLVALTSAMLRSPRGATLWRDELADWLAAMRDGADRAGWLAGWNGGGAYARESEFWTSKVERFPLNLVGALQPDHLADALAGDDGLAARFLYAWPEPSERASLAGPEADDDALVAMMQRISRQAGEADYPAVLRFSSEATAGLEQMLPGLSRLGRERDGAEAAWIGKGAGTIVRLAGLFNLMRWAEEGGDAPPGTVTLRDLDDAHALWSGYFLPHAESVFRLAGADGRDALVRRAARWLRRSGLSKVSREDIRSEALSRTVNAEGSDLVIDRLCEGGALRPLPAGGNSGRPKRRWEVNPALR